MPSIALYYPWMHFQDDEWLRLALLAWDSIVRVRPSAVEDREATWCARSGRNLICCWT